MDPQDSFSEVLSRIYAFKGIHAGLFYGSLYADLEAIRLDTSQVEDPKTHDERLRQLQNPIAGLSDLIDSPEVSLIDHLFNPPFGEIALEGLVNIHEAFPDLLPAA